MAWSSEGGFRLEGLVRASGKKRDVIDSGAFVPDAYAVVDLRMIYAPTHFFRIDAAIENVFDTLYWNWENVDSVRGNDDQADKDYHAENMRGLSLAVTFTF